MSVMPLHGRKSSASSRRCLIIALLLGACGGESPSSPGDGAELVDAASGDAGPGDVRPEDAQEAILAAFETHPLVGGMNASHGNKDADDFILDLIRNPRFPGAVNDIAVECGNSLHQPVLDRYVAGEDVPLVDVEPVWRDTLEPECGFSTLNERLIPLVRRLNQRLSPAQRLRVLACDSPVDWAQVRSREDLMALPETGDTIASVLENEVLSKGRKALLLFGIHHVMHGDSTAIGRLEARGYQGAALVIAEHIGFGNRASLPEDNQSLEARMASWPVPSLVSLEGTWLAELDSAYFNEPAGQRGYPGVDAYLYLGPRDLLLREPRSAQAVLDVDYIEALRQRATSIGAPPEGSMHPETIFGREEGATAFVYEPAP